MEEGRNGQQLERNLDLIEETRDEAAIKLQAYQQEAAKFYNKKFGERKFRIPRSEKSD